MMAFTQKYPRAARGLAFSFGFEGLSRYFGKELDGVIAACFERQGIRCTVDVCFLRHALLGLCLDFMRDEKKRTDPEASLTALRQALCHFEA